MACVALGQEPAVPIKQLEVRNGLEPVLGSHVGAPVDDVDLSDGQALRVGGGQAVELWGDGTARAAPIGVEINQGHLAGNQRCGDIDPVSVGDGLDILCSAGHG